MTLGMNHIRSPDQDPFSHYDTSGRIRKGPAPENLIVPRYAFLEGLQIRIG